MNEHPECFGTMFPGVLHIPNDQDVKGKVFSVLLERAGGLWRCNREVTADIQAWDACRAACDPKFAEYAIYEHSMPFNVSRAYDEALGIDTPRIWTAQRDKEMWAALQG